MILTVPEENDIPGLYAAVVQATERYQEAQGIADNASRTATNLLNELNGVKKAAPHSTGWHRL